MHEGLYLKLECKLVSNLNFKEIHKNVYIILYL